MPQPDSRPESSGVPGSNATTTEPATTDPATTGPPTGPPTTLSPLPARPVNRSGGYRWTWILIGLLWLVVLAGSGRGWLEVFGFDETRAAGWWLYTSLVIVTPACLLLALMSCGVVALLRKLGARKWPGVLQALPAVVTVLTATALLLGWILRPSL